MLAPLFWARCSACPDGKGPVLAQSSPVTPQWVQQLPLLICHGTQCCFTRLGNGRDTCTCFPDKVLVKPLRVGIIRAHPFLVFLPFLGPQSIVLPSLLARKWDMFRFWPKCCGLCTVTSESKHSNVDTRFPHCLFNFVLRSQRHRVKVTSIAAQVMVSPENCADPQTMQQT